MLDLVPDPITFCANAEGTSTRPYRFPDQSFGGEEQNASQHARRVSPSVADKHDIDASEAKSVEALTSASKCPDCNGSGVLAGFGFGASENAVDRPCSCAAAKRDEGPSLWTIVEQSVTYEGEYETHGLVVVRKHGFFAPFKWKASAGGTFVYDTQARQGVSLVVEVRGEKAPDMAIARLLCGLRDGTVTP